MRLFHATSSLSLKLVTLARDHLIEGTGLLIPTCVTVTHAGIPEWLARLGKTITESLRSFRSVSVVAQTVAGG